MCAVRDALTPVLEKAQAADIIVIGSPIYFSHPTGAARSFMERLMFPVLTYNAKVDEKSGQLKSTILNKTVPTAMIYTMGCLEEMIAECHYPEMFAETEKFLKTLYTYNAYQFDDYARYDVAEYVESMRAKYRDEHYPEDLQKAYELGRRLVQKARETQS